MGSEQGCQGEESQRFGPEVIGSEIMDPGVDQKNMGDITFHGIVSRQLSVVHCYKNFLINFFTLISNLKFSKGQGKDGSFDWYKR
jgi:hypothetical protein